MRCCQVVATVADPAAGPTYSVTGLAQALARRGVRSSLHSVAGWRGCDETAAWPGVADVRYPLDRNWIGARMCSSRWLKRDLVELARQADILHAHGLWLMPGLYTVRAARRQGARARAIVSPRGMLGREALAFSRVRKQVSWIAMQRAALSHSSCIHATCNEEYQEIRAAGISRPVAVVPNGIDVPERPPAKRDQGPKTILSLGRLHPKKGLDRLVEAWAGLEAAHPDWRLRIAGPAELGHDLELKRLVARLGLSRCRVEPAIYGNDKLEALAEASVFVLATRNENFAMTVAESLAAGTPVISTKGAPWSELEREQCGWWVDQGVGPLRQALQCAMSVPAGELRRMGQAGRRWMQRDFSWSRTGEQMLEVYRWVADGGAAACAPACVRLS